MNCVTIGLDHEVHHGIAFEKDVKGEFLGEIVLAHNAPRYTDNRSDRKVVQVQNDVHHEKFSPIVDTEQNEWGIEVPETYFDDYLRVLNGKLIVDGDSAYISADDHEESQQHNALALVLLQVDHEHEISVMVSNPLMSQTL